MALDYLPSPGWAVVYGETPAADRWSELGENDDALATGVGLDDSAIKNRHLANGAVTSPKIDFTTFPTHIIRNGGTINITTQSLYPLPSFNFAATKAGKYLLVLSGNMQPYNNLDRYPRLGLYVNGSRIEYAALRIRDADQRAFVVHGLAQLEVGDTVNVQAVGGECILFEGTRLTATLVG